MRSHLGGFKIMLRSVFVNLGQTCCKRHSSTRGGKVYKYIPTPVKSSIVNKESLPPPTKIDRATAEILERISLVGIENEKAVQVLEEAIAFADHIFLVDTSKVKPLFTVLEDESLYLREDVAELDVTRNELISHSEVTEENYYVTPIGNLEYIPEKKSFTLPHLKEACKE